MRAAVYVRISKDPEGLRAGVERQREDCLRLCEQRGWEPVIFEDNDASAYSGKPRPGFEAAQAAIKAGEVGVLVAWAPDRLTRHLRELEGLVTLIEATGAQVATVQGGDWDLTTPEGRFMARQLGLLARLESEKMAARHRRAKLAEAQSGRPHMGGPRPWGFEADRITHHPVEAAQVREAAQRLLAGEGIGTVARSVGRNPTALKRSLLAPHVAGLRRHHGEMHPGCWEPILDADTWAAVRAVLESRSDAAREPGGTRGRVTLLAGFLRCTCGGRMSGTGGQWPGYTCDRCKRVRRSQRRYDLAVREYVLENADLEVAAPGVDPALTSRVTALEALLADLDGTQLEPDTALPGAVYARQRAALEAKLAGARRLVRDAEEAAVAWLNVEHMERGPRYAENRAWWDRADLRQRRAVVAKYVAKVIATAPGEEPDVVPFEQSQESQFA